MVVLCFYYLIMNFLNVFVYRLEQDKSVESSEAIRNLVLMVASLSMCGYTELRPSPASVSSLFKMIDFTLPQPLGRGTFCITEVQF